MANKPKRLGDLTVERQDNQKLRIGIGTGSLYKAGGTPGNLGDITVDRTVSAPPTHGPAK